MRMFRCVFFEAFRCGQDLLKAQKSEKGNTKPILVIYLVYFFKGQHDKAHVLLTANYFRAIHMPFQVIIFI